MGQWVHTAQLGCDTSDKAVVPKSLFVHSRNSSRRARIRVTPFPNPGPSIRCRASRNSHKSARYSIHHTKGVQGLYFENFLEQHFFRILVLAYDAGLVEILKRQRATPQSTVWRDYRIESRVLFSRVHICTRIWLLFICVSIYCIKRLQNRIKSMGFANILESKNIVTYANIYVPKIVFHVSLQHLESTVSNILESTVSE